MSERKLVIVFLLSLLTFGIYNPFFAYSIAKELETDKGLDETKYKSLLKTKKEFIILHLITLGFYTLIWFYKLGMYFDYKYNENKYENLFLWSFFFVPFGICVVQKSINILIEQKEDEPKLNDFPDKEIVYGEIDWEEEKEINIETQYFENNEQKEIFTESKIIPNKKKNIINMNARNMFYRKNEFTEELNEIDDEEYEEEFSLFDELEIDEDELENYNKKEKKPF